jgi:plasmid stabilization system protein ParE
VTPKPLVWTDRATADLEEIGQYIALDDPVAAERWVEVLLATAQRAGELPFSGRRVPELGRDDIRDKTPSRLSVGLQDRHNTLVREIAFPAVTRHSSPYL